MLNTSNLEKAIEGMGFGGDNQFASCFNNFIDLALSFFCNNMDERQMFLRKHLTEDNAFKKSYQSALECFVDCAENYQDPLGNIFMSRVSHGEHGQFFTPDCISELCAELVGIESQSTVSDPCCGSGRMMLKALQMARARNGEIEIYANDLSITCSKMCLLNLVINSAGGMVTCSDALLNDKDKTTFFKIEKLWNLGTNKVMSTYWQYTTKTVDEVLKKRQQWLWFIAEHGWILWHNRTQYDEKIDAKDIQNIVKKDKETTFPTEIKVEENGQISMFN